MASAETIRFRKLTAHAHLPTKGSQKAAGFDLCAAYGYMIPARGNGLVMTDLQVRIFWLMHNESVRQTWMYGVAMNKLLMPKL